MSDVTPGLPSDGSHPPIPGNDGDGLKARLLVRARALGFDAVGITTAKPPESADHLHAALAEGRHGEMEWLARNAEKRTDPQRVLPGARSVVALAVSYAPADAATMAPTMATHAPSSLRGEVARYARHADYHDVLAAPLRELSAWLDQAAGPGTRSLWYVDTGPILERDLAERAGLGFVGKHTNLISRSLGNWFFLAELLTTADLEPDESSTRHCGHCTRCLDACPTRAITAPYTLDARRCISYLTIEHEGPIDVELRPLMGNRIYGCDDCQLVCPWNKYARRTPLPDFAPRPGLRGAGLLELWGWSEQEFSRRTEGTAIRRIGWERWRRNLAVAMGNALRVTRDASRVQALRQALSEALPTLSPLVREHAQWALDQAAAD